MRQTTHSSIFFFKGTVPFYILLTPRRLFLKLNFYFLYYILVYNILYYFSFRGFNLLCYYR